MHTCFLLSSGELDCTCIPHKGQRNINRRSTKAPEYRLWHRGSFFAPVVPFAPVLFFPHRCALIKPVCHYRSGVLVSVAGICSPFSQAMNQMPCSKPKCMNFSPIRRYDLLLCMWIRVYVARLYLASYKFTKRSFKDKIRTFPHWLIDQPGQIDIQTSHAPIQNMGHTDQARTVYRKKNINRRRKTWPKHACEWMQKQKGAFSFYLCAYPGITCCARPG